MSDDASDKAWEGEAYERIDGVVHVRAYDRHEVGYVLVNDLYVRGMKMRYDLHRDDVKRFIAANHGRPWE